MKIALSGAHSQGKTTLLNELVKDGRMQGYACVPSPTRILAAEGFSINESGNAKTQSMIMVQHFKNVTTFNLNALYDRCALDGLAYSMFFEKDLRDNKLWDIAVSVFEYTINQYDYIFYIEPELSLKDDGTRSVDYNFFNTVVNNFENIIKIYNLNVVRVKGTVQQRVDLIMKTINL